MLAAVLQEAASMSRDPKKLEVFHRAHRLALDVYALTESLPHAERYGLRAQLRRAATSVPTNIVEGSIRSGRREYHRFIDVALASAAEVQYLLDLAVDLRLLGAENSAHCRDCARWVVGELQNLLKTIAQFPD
jgi:four helix bundle protein